MKILKFVGALALLSLFQLSSAADFSESDLKKMVDELSIQLPQNPEVQYPVEASVVKKPDVNAYATVKEIAGNKEKVQGVMVVYTGLVDFAKGDLRLIRAVVAHELAHLSKGHMFKSIKVQDVDLLYTRQMEYEADMVGASALVRAGYPKKDMYDMLIMLGETEAGDTATGKLLGDHADSKRRASQVAENPSILKSYLAFEMGEAFADCRSFYSAMKAFDSVLLLEPKFKEAAVNSASSALQYYYYTGLPKAYQESHFRPDFGALLKAPAVPKLIKVDDTTRALYKEALLRIKRAQDLAPSDPAVIELAGLAAVLNPDEDPQAVTGGITALKRALSTAIMPADKMRISNNIAVGLQIQKDVLGAVEQMMDAQRGNAIYNAALAQNLGQQEFPAKLKADAGLAAGVMKAYLVNSPEGNPALYARVKANYIKTCNTFGYKVEEVTPKPIYLCKALSLFDEGHEYPILTDPTEFIDTLGAFEKKILFDKNYKGLYELVFKGGQFLVLVEDTDAIRSALRVTSYHPGAYIEIQPRDPSVSSYRFTVGMTTAEFNQSIDLSKGQPRSFVRAGTIENWVYFPGLFMGVCVKDDKIIGLTCTPSATPPPAK